MMNEMKDRIRNTVNLEYTITNDRDCSNVCSMDISIIVPSFIGYSNENIIIERSVKKDDLTYKLYTKHDKNPLVTTYGCWPTEFVSDIFIRALEHFYNNY